MDKKRVDILLSIYQPNLEYLVKQLQSLNAQTYEKIKLYVFDDCVHNRTSKDVFTKNITNFECEFLPYESNNLGYAKAFEKLIDASSSEYVAFCDQDDIWHPNKIEECVEKIKLSNCLVTVTDQEIIDSDDNVIKESTRNNDSKSLFDNWSDQDDISSYNLFQTFAPGMSIVARGDFARSILPIPDAFAHDTWIMQCAATIGCVSYIDKSLVQYRRHGKNVSGLLIGIDSKLDYKNKRINSSLQKVNEFLKRYPDYWNKENILEFVNARNRGNVVKIWKYRKYAPNIAKFEIVYNIIPNFLFKVMLKMMRKI